MGKLCRGRHGVRRRSRSGLDERRAGVVAVDLETLVDRFAGQPDLPLDRVGGDS